MWLERITLKVVKAKPLWRDNLWTSQLFEKLKEKDIIARKYFYPLINGFDCYKSYETAGEEKTPVAKDIASKVLTLPLFADLTTEIIDKICDIILN